MSKLTTMTDQELQRARSDAQIALILASNDPAQLIALIEQIEAERSEQRHSERAAAVWLKNVDTSKGEKV